MARIMVVDDEKDLVQLVSSILKSVGHEVIGAHSGYEALEMLKSERPDLILLDIMMPELDGWQTLELIREQEDLKSVPVAMLTALTLTPKTVGKEEISELIDYIEKPFDRDTLIKKVNYNIIEDLEAIARNKSKLSSISGDEKTVTSYEIAARLERLHKNILATLNEGLSRMEGSVRSSELRAAIISQQKAIELFRRKREEIEKRISEKVLLQKKAAIEVYQGP